MMLLSKCEIYDLKKSTLDLDVEIDKVKSEVNVARGEKENAEVILSELTEKDASYAKIKKRVTAAKKDLETADKILSKLESEYDQKLMDGKFEILEKVMVDRKVIRGPDFKLKWGSLMWEDRERSSIARWKATFGATFVIPKDKVWVEGATWTGEYFKKGDAVLMKIPLEVYIEKREKEVAKSKSAKERKRREFGREMKADGTRMYSPEELEEIGL